MMDFTHRVVLAAPIEDADDIVVARWAEAVVVIAGSVDAIAVALDLLHPADQAEPSGAMVIERLPTVRDTDVAAAVITPSGWWLSSTGRARIDAGGGANRNQAPHTVDATTPSLWLGVGERPAEAGAASLDLRSGVVAARGAQLILTTDGTSEVPRPDDATPFEVVDLASAVVASPREPLPIASEPEPSPAPRAEPSPSPQGGGAAAVGGSEILGIQCSRSHFNNPNAAYCQVCGISMVHLTHYLIPGIRPTLGFLVFDDGATFALDRSYRVGREPLIESGSSLAPLVLRDQRHSVSRSHAELLLDGWDVLVSDLGSTNGTFIWDAGQQTWGRVMPGDPKIIAPGTIVAIGRKTFVYETVARSV